MGPIHFNKVAHKAHKARAVAPLSIVIHNDLANQNNPIECYLQTQRDRANQSESRQYWSFIFRCSTSSGH